MKSQEFISEQELEEYSQTDVSIRRTLEKKGYKFLAAGVDQSAYLEPGSNMVLKVFGTQKNSDNFSEDHLMFFKWAKFCDKHKDNQFLPKFFGYDSFIFKGNRYLQIRQEKLYDLDQNTADLLEAMADEVEYGNDGFNTFVKLLPVEYDPEIDESYKDLVSLVGIKNIRKLYDTIKKINNIGDKQSWMLDLHGSNFMKRIDGTPVIVDPWVLPG
jgi:hypothetical protein